MVSVTRGKASTVLVSPGLPVMSYSDHKGCLSLDFKVAFAVCRSSDIFDNFQQCWPFEILFEMQLIDYHYGRGKYRSCIFSY